ncbi:hypothetical protein CUMW_258650, partial [Citrus unshiu]
MKNKDVISWTDIVSGYINRGQVDIARQYFAQMPERDYVLWTAMIDGYLRVNRFREALTLFPEMQTSNIRPDEFTIVRILTAYMYCKCGDVEKAQRVLRKMLRKDKFTWTAMIVGLAISDPFPTIRPDEVTYVGVLSACTHNGNETFVINSCNLSFDSDSVLPLVIKSEEAAVNAISAWPKIS